MLALQELNIDLDRAVTDNTSLRVWAKLGAIRSLDLACTQVTDAALEDFAGMRFFSKAINLNGDLKVMDVGITKLAGRETLRKLCLERTQVTDEGIKELARLNSLESLDLADTKVTDAGIKELAGLAKLESLNLAGTKITDRAIAELAGLKNLRNLLDSLGQA